MKWAVWLVIDWLVIAAMQFARSGKGARGRMVLFLLFPVLLIWISTRSVANWLEDRI